jgi:hypothetical protein
MLDLFYATESHATTQRDPPKIVAIEKDRYAMNCRKKNIAKDFVAANTMQDL